MTGPSTGSGQEEGRPDPGTAATSSCAWLHGLEESRLRKTAITAAVLPVVVLGDDKSLSDVSLGPFLSGYVVIDRDAAQ
jgi:hypothetical protein